MPRFTLSLLAATAFCLLGGGVQAQLGGTAGEQEEKPVEQARSYEGQPLLVIRFNQRRVYFERALRQAVDAAERAKDTVQYEVVSYGPEVDKRRMSGERVIDQAQENLRAVVEEMRQQGVDGGRIHTSTEPGDGMVTQEIHIFVR